MVYSGMMSHWKEIFKQNDILLMKYFTYAANLPSGKFAKVNQKDIVIL